VHIGVYQNSNMEVVRKLYETVFASRGDGFPRPSYLQRSSLHSGISVAKFVPKFGGRLGVSLSPLASFNEFINTVIIRPWGRLVGSICTTVRGGVDLIRNLVRRIVRTILTMLLVISVALLTVSAAYAGWKALAWYFGSYLPQRRERKTLEDIERHTTNRSTLNQQRPNADGNRINREARSETDARRFQADFRIHEPLRASLQGYGRHYGTIRNLSNLDVTHAAYTELVELTQYISHAQEQAVSTRHSRVHLLTCWTHVCEELRRENTPGVSQPYISELRGCLWSEDANSVLALLLKTSQQLGGLEDIGILYIQPLLLR
jgi:hypothetical protein